MNEVVKYDNYMNSLNFSKFNQVDMNFLLVLCNRMKDKDTQKINLTCLRTAVVCGCREPSIISFVLVDKELLRTEDTAMLAMFSVPPISRREVRVTRYLCLDMGFYGKTWKYSSSPAAIPRTRLS